MTALVRGWMVGAESVRVSVKDSIFMEYFLHLVISLPHTNTVIFLMFNFFELCKKRKIWLGQFIWPDIPTVEKTHSKEIVKKELF